MESIVMVAIGVLCLVFVGSLTALIMICHHRYCRKDFFSKHFTDSRPDVGLISGHNGYDNSLNNMELDDVRLHPNIDKILADTQWVDDATGLIPHCLAILKSCHHLTERLVAATMSAMTRYQEEEQQYKLWEIIRVAQRISPRVDDVVQSMYPPLDPRLLDSRCLSLVLAVSQLAIVIKYLCHVKSQWIQEALDELDFQLKVLRDAGQLLLDTSVAGNTTTNANSDEEINIENTAQN
ncbi:transmembrane protein 98-like [Oppia nitens]|uniref:transmembrane protein 98-like n=1 Tax=Oppia nitens TaxID=1686743 RepID=UPI0023DCC9D3|nr:transmembrane protein 98-like [Oppia nitens]